MTGFRQAITAWTLVGFLMISGFNSEVWAQASADPMGTPDWGDYPMLMSQFGELCTMCEAYVQCRPEPADSTTDRDFTLYYFQNKTFWGQIATIWDYFARWFDPVTSQSRPATVYKFSSDATVTETPLTAYLSVAESEIQIEKTRIDRTKHSWMNEGGDEIGTCKRLGIPESMAMIENGLIIPGLSNEESTP
ncbi:MAG: hypothetical protein GKS03_15210 [Alphaproteobacteria bacterium]|nr:hypothetical protein [Alphaproteobacteria bacterium]